MKFSPSLLLASLLFPALALAQAPEQGPLAPRVAEVLRRSGNGHSPTPEEIAPLVQIAPLPPVADLQAAVPLLMKALENPDTPVRTFALTAMTGLESPILPEVEPAPPAADGTTIAPPPVNAASIVPTAYKPEAAALLAPEIPRIATHLREESQTNRLLTVAILGGFTPNPPASVFAPLFNYLKRDDAIGPVGFAVVSDLLQFGLPTNETAEAIAKYLRRADQTPDSRANLVDAIAAQKNQSPVLNKVLLSYLRSDDPSLRARVILSLPQLDLAPDDFAETRARVSQLIDNTNENLQVINAAKAVATCWTQVKMTAGCPVY